MASLDTLMSGQTDDQIRTELLRRLMNERTNFGCIGGELPRVEKFFKDPKNMPAIREAIDAFGMFPENRQAIRRLFGWSDYCDYEPLARFYLYAVVCSLFPKPVMNQQNCEQIKALKLEVAKLSSNPKAYVVEPAFEQFWESSVQRKASEYEKAYAQMNCEQYILDLQAQKASILRTQQRKEEAEAQAAASKDVLSTPASNLGIWILGGVAVLIAGILTVRAFKRTT
jgi:Zn finger protein HypA/HybF involved in hydrogenase expression